ncbi:aminopeptidase P family protein [Bacteroidota bacterium]
MNTIVERVSKLRKYMKDNGLNAFIIPSGDPHFGEYIQHHFSCREWISGFTGSAGTVVITENDGALWTDSRYFLQAQTELEGSGIELMKMRMPETPSIPVWLNKVLKAGSNVGIDSSLFSKTESDALISEIKPLNIVFANDPFEIVWSERPHIKFSPVRGVSKEISGADTRIKLDQIVRKLNCKGEFLYILSSCDDIAWLCNIRGTDIPYNPLVLSYAAFTRNEIYLFTGEGVVDSNLKNDLEKSGVSIHSYHDFENFIREFDNTYTRVAPADKISVRMYNAAIEKGADFIPDTIRGGVTGSQKALKNEAESEGFRDAMINDGVAWIRFWKYLEEELNSGNDNLTEEILAGKIGYFRSLSNKYMGESFSPIVAFGGNAAMPHYSPFGNGPVKITKDGFLLVDTGGQYINGTTDTTRTFILGKLTEEQIQDYTLVLKGMVNLSMARFIKGTRGASLDILARGPVFSAGKLYSHGTGHGIGHNLCVHEGPQSIRMEENPVILEPGMVISNEPAIYEEGRYGIRIENTILCKKWTENKFGEFYEFETLTLVPIETRCIDLSLLGAKEKEWLNSYHSLVYTKLSPLLTDEERLWLTGKTLQLN